MRKTLLFFFALAGCSALGQNYTPGRITIEDPGYIAGATFRPSFDSVASALPLPLFTGKIYLTYDAPSALPLSFAVRSSSGRNKIPCRVNWGDGTIAGYDTATITRNMIPGRHTIIISYNTCTEPSFLCTNDYVTKVVLASSPDMFYVDLHYCIRLDTLITAGDVALNYLNIVHDTSLYWIDPSTNDQLMYLYATASGLRGVGVVGCEIIDYINADSCTHLTEIRSNGSTTSFITCRGCTALQYIYAYNSLLSYLNVSGCTALYWIEVQDNAALTSLGVSGAGNLSTIKTYGSSLSEFSITSLISSMKDRTSLGAGTCNIVPMADGFPQTLTVGQQNSLATKNWTEL